MNRLAQAQRDLGGLLQARFSVLSSSNELSWRRLLGYLRPYRLWMAVALLALLVSTAVGLLLPLAVGQLVNSFADPAARFDLNQVALALVAVILVQALFSLVQSYALSFVGERVVSDLRTQAYTHLQRLSLDFFNNRRTGEITSRITNDVTLIQTTVTSNVANLLGAVVQFVGALALMIAVSWQLSSLALILVPAVTLLGLIFGRVIRRISTAVQDRLADASSVLEETVAGVRVVQSFGREPYEVGRFRAAVEATFATAMRRARVRAVFQPLVAIAAWGTMVAVLWFGGRLVLAGALRPGDLIAFMLYAGNISGTLATLSGLFGQLQEALGAVTRVFELLDTEPTVADRPGAVGLGEAQGRVTFEEVSFAYEDARAEGQEEQRQAASPLPERAQQAVLRGLSLEISPGEVLALVGPSGAGKSTIVNLVPRFYDVQAGSVRVDGHDVRDVTLASLRRQIGIVPQETLLFSGSVQENIRYGRLEASDTEVEAAARAANAHEFILALPQGYATPVGERGVKLSGGQRQRVAIARAILKDPRILILDEATSALDSESEGLVQQALERLMRGRTSIVIAHRLSTIRRADRIAVIVAGELAELGRHAELMARGGLYARLYAMQFREDDRTMFPSLAELSAD
jgi:subfamily B ATP-binding cassette protein MsbA